jgi:hypothetical protein
MSRELICPLAQRGIKRQLTQKRAHALPDIE